MLLLFKKHEHSECIIDILTLLLLLKRHERSEHKKLMSEANSELLLLFLKVTQILTKNCPDESSESEIQ
jgi:hypothetical protein